jgi:hypothetical protein
MKKKTTIQSAALAVLVLTAGGVLFYESNSAGASDRDTPSTVVYKPLNVDNPQIHWDRLTDSQANGYKTTGRDIFNWKLPAPPVPSPVHIPGPGDADYQAPAVPPPPPPKLPLKFFGLGTDARGGARRAFLADGNEVYIVAEGDTVLGHFRILRISAGNLEFEEISSGRRAFKTLDGPEPGA